MTVSYVSCSFACFITSITVSYGYHLYLHSFPSSLHMSQYYPTHNFSSFHPDTSFRRIVNRTCCNAHASREFTSRAVHQTRKKMVLQWLKYRHPCSKVFRTSAWGYQRKEHCWLVIVCSTENLAHISWESFQLTRGGDIQVQAFWPN